MFAKSDNVEIEILCFGVEYLRIECKREKHYRGFNRDMTVLFCLTNHPLV